MSYIVTIAAGVSASTSTAAVLEVARRILRRNGVRSDAIVLRNLPAADLLRSRPDRPVWDAAQCLIERAQGIVIATPIQEVVYSSLLRTFLDTLRPNILQEKTVLSVTTGSSVTRILPPDDRLKPLLAALKGSAVLPTLSIAENHILFEHGGLIRLEEEAENLLQESLGELAKTMLPSVSGAVESAELGYYSASAYPRR